MGQGVIIVNIILCNDVCFTHVTIIHNLLTYLLIYTAMMSYYIECEDMNVSHVEQDVLPFRST
jgi:hypothetical protein